MKKGLLLITMAILPLMVAGQAVNDFFVDFESGIPGDWTIVSANTENENGNTDTTWTLDDTHGRDGSQCIYLDTHPGPADDWLISPLTKLTADYVFSFWAYCSAGYPDTIRVMASKTGTDPGDFNIVIDTITMTGDYERYSFVPTDNDDLTASDEVYLALHVYTHGSYTDVDDIYYGEFVVTVTMEQQIVTNAADQTVVAQSNASDGFIYLILDGEPQSSIAEMDAAVVADKGVKAEVTAPLTDVSLSTEGLVPGYYYAYAVDGSNNISEKSTKYVGVKSATETAVDTFFVDFESGIPIEWTIINANEGENDNGNSVHTWVLDPDHGLEDSQCLYNDTYPGPADDWFVSPLTKLTAGYVFSLWGYGSATYPDSLAIFVSKTGKAVEDFTVEIARFELPGSYTKFSFVLTENQELNDGDEVYIGIHNYTEGSYTDMDEVEYNESGFGSIYEAYTVSDTEIDIIFDDPVGGSSLEAANYVLQGSEEITFTTATVDAGDETLLHLSGASSSITGDATVDSILNSVTGEYFKMFAGICPVAFANINNPGGFLGTEYPATFKLIVMAKNAEDDGRRVWLGEAAEARGGTNSYGSEFYQQVDIGDEVLILSEVSPFENQTELLYPKLIKKLSTGNALIDPAVIAGADINKNIAADTDPAEKWEGPLVKVEAAMINSFTAPYFFASDDGGTTEFRVGNGLELFDAPFNELLMDVGAKYDITGFVINRDGDYRLVPRDMSDMVLVQGINVEENIREPLQLYPNPAADVLMIRSAKSIGSIDVLALDGRFIEKIRVHAPQVELRTGTLEPSVYLLKISFEDGSAAVKRFIKR